MEIQKKAAQYFSSRPEVVFAFLFGSSAREEITPLSDIDLAVYIDKSSVSTARGYDLRSELTSELMSVFQSNKVDLILLNEAPPLLRHRIMSQGKKIIVRDEIQEQRFFVKTIQDYFDTLPLRSIQAHYLKKYFQGLKPPGG